MNNSSLNYLGFGKFLDNFTQIEDKLLAYIPFQLIFQKFNDVN
jgi:hypothetical protein